MLVCSRPLIRDYLRTAYHLEEPAYYSALPADTEANRQRVAEYLAKKEKMALAAAEPTPNPPKVETHGRTVAIDMLRPFDAHPIEPPEALSNEYLYSRGTCHWRWDWAGRWFALCRDVDQATLAAIHYDDDVEAYWTPRLRPDSSGLKR